MWHLMASSPWQVIARDAAAPEFDVKSVTHLVTSFTLLVAFVEAVKFYDLGIQPLKSHSVRGFIKHYRKWNFGGRVSVHFIQFVLWPIIWMEITKLYQCCGRLKMQSWFRSDDSSIRGGQRLVDCPTRWSLFDIWICRSSIYFDTQMTKKYSTALCNSTTAADKTNVAR